MANKIKTAADVLRDSECLFEITQNEAKLNEYHHFLKYFSDIDEINKHEFIVGANMVYGWMSVSLSMKSEHMDSAVEALNKVKKGFILDSDEIESIKRTVNNSMVGTSKLLHVVNPNLYPVWTSNVSSYLVGLKSHHAINKVELYQNYMAVCFVLADNPEFKEKTKRFEKHIGQNISELRAASLVMHLKGFPTSKQTINCLSNLTNKLHW